MLQNGIHLGGEDTGGAVQCGKGFIKLRHVTADGGIFLDEINFLAGIGQFQRGLNPGNTAAHHHHIGIDVDHPRRQGSQKPGPGNRTVEKRLGLGCSFFNIMRNPGHLLTDVDNRQKILIQSGRC